MKNIITILFLAFCQFANAFWYTDFKEAKKIALASNKLLIVDFYADWCGPCKKMDYDSWDNALVVDVLSTSYIKVKVDIDSEKGLANQYNISSIPNMYILDFTGKEIHNFSGYHDANQLKRELEKFAYSTEFVQNESVVFSKNQDCNNAMQLALKYLDYSCYLPQDIRKNFVRLGEKYLTDARKLNNPKGNDFAYNKEKIDLLNLFQFAYLGNFDKLKKKLLKIDSKSIDAGNLQYLHFLQLMVAKSEKNDDDVEKILVEAQKNGDFKYYSEKAGVLISKIQS